jgi:transposase
MLAFSERAAGERLFVDYAGHTVDVVCPKTGEVRTAQIFVARLGASSYTYVEATWTQSLPTARQCMFTCMRGGLDIQPCAGL